MGNPILNHGTITVKEEIILKLVEMVRMIYSGLLS